MTILFTRSLFFLEILKTNLELTLTIEQWENSPLPSNSINVVNVFVLRNVSEFLYREILSKNNYIQ